MKKFIVGMVAATMAAAGLVASTEATATAAPYPGTVDTTTKANGLGPFNNRAKVFVRVRSDSGHPRGRVEFTLVHRRTDKVEEYHRHYVGAHTFTLSNLDRGRYRVIVTFVPRHDSKWKPSSDRTRVKVL